MLTQQTLTRLRALKLDGMARAFEEHLSQPAAHALLRGARRNVGRSHPVRLRISFAWRVPNLATVTFKQRP